MCASAAGLATDLPEPSLEEQVRHHDVHDCGSQPSVNAKIEVDLVI